ncbi:MAG: hypothetical protein M3N34_01895 [Pseudomonadota bacterium]|nr:hypothetical protein [Pseudomonadota bacterium]
MTTIIRRDRRRHLGHPALLLIAVAAAVLVAVLAAWALMVIWKRGGPQPVHEIVIAIPAPRTGSPHLAAHSALANGRPA